MEQFIEYFLKSAGVLSIFVLVYHFLLRRLTFFQANRWFLIVGIMASILFPLVEITQTVYIEKPLQEVIYVPQHLVSPMAMVLEQPSVPVDMPFDYWQLFAFIYIAIVIFFIGKMTIELISLFKLINSGEKFKDGKFIMVTLSRKLTPFSFFNYICYSDTEKPSAALDLILNHEKAHARQWHSMDILLSHLYRAVFWINPLAWWLKRQIGENLEYVADAEAKNQTKSDVNYERTLLSSAAFHLQPSLANNFFTPFIKKRIMMLQKEASARWNAYKYALILPVIVLFLYSFNVVTKVEYIESKLEKENKIETTNQVFEKGLKINDEPHPIFDITSKTSDKELTEFANTINNYANYKVRFSDQERDGNEELKRLSVSTKFPEKDWNKNITLETQPSELLFIKAGKDELWVNDDSSTETMYITEKGVHLEMEDWVYGDMIVEQTEDLEWKRKGYEDTIVSIKITSTTTEKSLEKHKKWLKETHNVDFKYSKLKYKDGEIVSIKIQLDDNRGYKGTQSYKETDGISNICIKGVLNEKNRFWSMNNCSDFISPKLGDVQYFDLTQREFDKIKQMNLDSIISNTQMTMINMDSLKSEMKYQFKSINIDSLKNQMKDSFIYLDSDSLINHIQSLPRALTLRELSSLGDLGDDLPLVIVDGLVEDFNSSIIIDDDHVQSIITLKDKDVVIIDKDRVVVQDDIDEEKLEKRYEEHRKTLEQRREALEQRREKMEEGRMSRDSIIAVRKQEVEKRRKILIGTRKEKKEQLIGQLGERRDLLIKRAYARQSGELLDSDTLMNFNRAMLEKYGEEVRDKGYSFKIKTFRSRSNKVTKLKLEFAGSTYTFTSDKGVEKLTFNYYKDGRTPTLTAINN